MSDSPENITKEEIEKFRRNGLLDVTGLIYYVIRKEYSARLEAEFPEKTKTQIIAELTEELQRRGYNGSIDAVTKIIYSDRKKNKICGLNFKEFGS